jgi:hypothetical protein
MFKRKQQVEEVVPGAAPATEPAAEETTIDVRTTTYPQDDGEKPAVQGHSRTTVYRQSLLWSRRTYDTIN